MKATVSATLIDATTGKAIAGATLTLSANSGKGYAKIGTATTSSSGTAHLVLKPTANTFYRWTFAGTATHGKATGKAVRVKVTQVVRAKLRPASVAKGTAAGVWGTLLPNVRGG